MHAYDKIALQKCTNQVNSPGKQGKSCCRVLSSNQSGGETQQGQWRLQRRMCLTLHTPMLPKQVAGCQGLDI